MTRRGKFVHVMPLQHDHDFCVIEKKKKKIPKSKTRLSESDAVYLWVRDGQVIPLWLTAIGALIAIIVTSPIITRDSYGTRTMLWQSIAAITAFREALTAGTHADVYVQLRNDWCSLLSNKKACMAHRSGRVDWQSLLGAMLVWPEQCV